MQLTPEQLHYRLANNRCIDCGQTFAQGVNVHTAAGWKETELSGMCENCFEALFEGEEE